MCQYFLFCSTAMLSRSQPWMSFGALYICLSCGINGDLSTMRQLHCETAGLSHCETSSNQLHCSLADSMLDHYAGCCKFKANLSGWGNGLLNVTFEI